MAFLRSYSEAGDPPARTLRAGRLQRSTMRGTVATVARAHGFHNKRVTARLNRRNLAHLRAMGFAGDPFSFRLPKFVRKLSLKKVVKGVGNLARAALPIVAPFIPGGTLLGAVTGALAGGGSPESPAPELVMSPMPTGTVGEVSRQGAYYDPARGYEIEGVEVRAPRYRPPVDDYYDDDEDEDYAGDEYDDEDEYDQDLADSMIYDEGY
ncbi:MAG TPA: hypothetical protein VN903_24540 [Polyangia bacterium]|nr:hypothetical protein [Polyangia bacterium]